MLSPKLKQLQETLQKLIRRNAKPNVVKAISKTHPADLAIVFGFLLPHEMKYLFNLINNVETKADILSEVEPEIGAVLLDELDIEQCSTILSEMDPDDAAEIISELPEDKASSILAYMEDKESLDVEKLLEYPIETAGRIMTPSVFALPENTTVSEAIDAIQKATEAEMVFYLYVVDSHGKLRGIVSLRQLLTADRNATLGQIMNPEVISVNPNTDQEEVARLVARYNFLAIPVIDDKGVLLGIVTVDDVIDIIKDEATEDIYKMSGAGLREEDFVSRSSTALALRRSPWLVATFLGGMINSVIIASFEETLAKQVALVFFIPIILGMGGNVGSQTVAVMIRGLATGKFDVRQIWRILFKNLRVGILMGLFYGLIIALFASTYKGDLKLACSIGCGMLISMSFASLIGVLFPMVLERMKLDPAIASGPLVTTTTDIFGAVCFLGIANLFMSLLY